MTTQEDSTSERICPECKHLLRFVLGGKCRVLMPDGSRCEHTCSFSEAAGGTCEHGKAASEYCFDCVRKRHNEDMLDGRFDGEDSAASEGVPDRIWLSTPLINREYGYGRYYERAGAVIPQPAIEYVRVRSDSPSVDEVAVWSTAHSIVSRILNEVMFLNHKQRLEIAEIISTELASDSGKEKHNDVR